MKLKTLMLSLFATLALGANAKNYHPLLEDIKEQLADNYVFPQIGQKYAERITQCQQENCLDGIEDGELIAKKLSEMLNAVHKDKHLSVFPPGFESPIQQRRVVKKDDKTVTKVNTGITEQQILEGNIGYINYTMFPGAEEAFQATDDAMKFMQDTRAIIFDVREHRGGHPRHVDIIAEYLFQEPTHILTTRSPYNNDGKPWKLISEPNDMAPQFADKPVYILTSERSGSAAEHFTMAMKATGRAIVVGETTGGYGHWGGTVSLAKGFSMFVPNGGSYHPTTGLGWEEIGVTPDIFVDDEKSLDYTLKRIETHVQ